MTKHDLRNWLIVQRADARRAMTHLDVQESPAAKHGLLTRIEVLSEVLRKLGKQRKPR